MLVVRNAEDVARALHTHDHAERRRIGEAFRERALREHTYQRRAAQADYAFRECLARRQGKTGEQMMALATMENWRAVPEFAASEEEAYA
jgi:hypothetical protein